MTHVNPSNSFRPGDDTYAKVIGEIGEQNVCPFCPENIPKFHKKPILRDSEYWTVTFNMYPYDNTLHHFLFILKTHKVHLDELTLEEWADLHQQIKEITTEYTIKGATFFMRFGETALTGASVTHIHCQLVCPDPDNPDRKPIMVKAG